MKYDTIKREYSMVPQGYEIDFMDADNQTIVQAFYIHKDFVQLLKVDCGLITYNVSSGDLRVSYPEKSENTTNSTNLYPGLVS